MIQCQLCGRWIMASRMKEHADEHDLQLQLDHTGPHGTCDRQKVSPSCKCPDPVLTNGAYVCTCCEGVLANLEGDTWVGT